MKVVPISKHIMGYPVKVWLLTTLLTPVLFIFWSTVWGGEKPAARIWALLPVYMIIFLLFSLPAFALHLICFWKLAGSDLTQFKRKFLLILAGYICMLPSILIFVIVFRSVRFSTLAGNYLLLFLLLTFTLWSLLLKTRLE